MAAAVAPFLTAISTSIRVQFEQLQIDWANSTTNPELGHQEGFDMIIGQNGSAGAQRQRSISPRDSQGIQEELSTLADWVIPTRGGYFFSPSRAALMQLTQSWHALTGKHQ